MIYTDNIIKNHLLVEKTMRENIRLLAEPIIPHLQIQSTIITISNIINEQQTFQKNLNTFTKSLTIPNGALKGLTDVGNIFREQWALQEQIRTLLKPSPFELFRNIKYFRLIEAKTNLLTNELELDNNSKNTNNSDDSNTKSLSSHELKQSNLFMISSMTKPDDILLEILQNIDSRLISNYYECLEGIQLSFKERTQFLSRGFCSAIDVFIDRYFKKIIPMKDIQNWLIDTDRINNTDFIQNKCKDKKPIPNKLGYSTYIYRHYDEDDFFPKFKENSISQIYNFLKECAKARHDRDTIIDVFTMHDILQTIVKCMKTAYFLCIREDSDHN